MTDDLLMTLAAYGKPSLHRMDRGWWCRLELVHAGATVKIDSETNHSTPRLAVSECVDRLMIYIRSSKTSPQRVDDIIAPRLNTEEV